MENDHSGKKSNKYHLRSWVIWIAASMFYLYEYFVRIAPSVMHDELNLYYQVNAGLLATSLATYYYIYSPMQIFVGVLFDRFGGKRLIVPATLIVAIGSIIPAIPDHNIWMMTFARFLMGFGSAFAFVGTMYLVTVWFPSNRLAFFSGITTTLGMLGGMLGGRFMATIVDDIGWQGTFFWFGLAGVPVVLLLLFAIPKTPAWENKRRKENQMHSFFDGLKIVLRNKQTWLIGIVGSCLYLSLSVFGELWGIKYIMSVTGVTKKAAASSVSYLYFGWLIGGPLVGWLSDKIGNRRAPMLWGCIFSGILFWILILFPSLPLTSINIILFAAGLISSVEVISFIATMEANPAHTKGTSIGVTNMIVMLIGGLFQPVIGFIAEMKSLNLVDETMTGITQNTSANFQSAMMIIPIMLILGAILCLFIKKNKP